MDDIYYRRHVRHHAGLLHPARGIGNTDSMAGSQHERMAVACRSHCWRTIDQRPCDFTAVVAAGSTGAVVDDTLPAKLAQMVSGRVVCRAGRYGSVTGMGDTSGYRWWRTVSA